MARTRTKSYSLPFGELMTQTFAVYLRNFAPFFLLSALVFSPWAVLKWVLEHQTDLMYQTSGRPGTNEFYAQMAASWGLAAFGWILGMLLVGAITYGVVQQLRGSPADIGDCVTIGLRNLGKVLGTGFLAGLRIMVGTMLCWVPGIIETCRLFVAIPAAVMEGNGATKNIDRSIRLTMGSRWQIFGVLVFVNGILMAVPIAITFWATANNRAEILRSTWFFWVEVILMPILQIASATAGSVAYFMLRKGKENIDVKELAAVFD